MGNTDKSSNKKERIKSSEFSGRNIHKRCLPTEQEISDYDFTGGDINPPRHKIMHIKGESDKTYRDFTCKGIERPESNQEDNNGEIDK